MADKKNNWAQSIVACIGMISVAIVAIILKQPAALLGIVGVVIVVSWID